MKHGQNSSPFFVLGCVRSGTTLLRDLLRLHPHLECPEETHFFRWPDPYASPRFMHPYTQNKFIKKQREMDGISEQEFMHLIETSGSRSELAEAYGNLFLKKQDNPHGRWFDKTPQNIYGILLISRLMPASRFIHIHRNPLNVVTSLLQGKVLLATSITDAISYWCEAMVIINEYKRIAADRVLEISYEHLTSNPLDSMSTVLEFLNENPDDYVLPDKMVHKENNKYLDTLSEQQIDEVKQRCSPYYSMYGYK